MPERRTEPAWIPRELLLWIQDPKEDMKLGKKIMIEMSKYTKLIGYKFESRTHLISCLGFCQQCFPSFTAMLCCSLTVGKIYNGFCMMFLDIVRLKYCVHAQVEILCFGHHKLACTDAHIVLWTS